MNTISKMREKLSDPEYRKAFVASQINMGIPFQIRALLKSRGWTQEVLANQTGMLQPRVSGLMTPGKTRPNIETLRRIAEAFDCGLIVRFAPFSELARWSNEFDPESFHAPAFADDCGFIERKPVSSQVGSAMQSQYVGNLFDKEEVRSASLALPTLIVGGYRQQPELSAFQYKIPPGAVAAGSELHRP